ncbi:hypothetical protein ACJ73_01911 [Blastomyces percursus]|uniref:Uncharacterized protein n=1 Tax=Blastomyces percursus TaxID=1658174 RepID=A0A1J9RDP2_9EURO|nr:hypothetical protein ACJ73_01911 [Blastomyces percursus]
MTGNRDPVKYLPLPDSFKTYAEDAIAAISTIVNSNIQDSAFQFDLPPECGILVKEAQNIYQTERGLQEKAAILRQDGGVFRDIWKAGGLRHVITIPLIKVDDAQVFAWRKTREERVIVKWDWREAIFTPELTYFEVEQGKKVGAVVVQFEPTQDGK